MMKHRLIALTFGVLISQTCCTKKEPTKFEEVPFGQKSFSVAYPNKDLTPGAVVPNATKELVCKPGYSRSMRDELTNDEKKAVYRRYDMDYDSEHYQIDHLIPISIGGSNDITNLWPQPIERNIGFLGKQQVANYLHNEVCAGRMEISVAQEKIKKDWHAVYLTLQGKGKKK